MTRILESLEHAPPRQLAVVDYGSNTFRLVIFRFAPGGPHRLVDEIRMPVRISAGMTDGQIATDALARARDAADLFAAICMNKEVDAVDAVATSAIRDATNQGEILDILETAGVPPRVLSVEEEARYGLLGAVNSTTLTDGVVLDIGGGSMQISQAHRRRMGEFLSRPLGAVRMTEAFLAETPTPRGALRSLKAHVREELAQEPWMHAAQDRLIGVGGAIRTLAKMDQKRTRYPLGEIHGYSLTFEALDELIGTMRRASSSERRRIPGLREDRADIMLAGAAVVREAMKLMGADRIEVCDQGLREGVFYEHLLAPAEPPLVSDVRRAGVENLASAYGYNRPHAENVARLAGATYGELVRIGLQEDDPWEREILWAASLLHDVGVLVDYNDHHKHSYYLVLNAGLPGHDHRELALVAGLVRGHRKRLPSASGLSGILRDADSERLLRLGACLRLAEALEQARDGAVRGIRARQVDSAIELVLECAAHPGVVVSAARAETHSLEGAFGPTFLLVGALAPESEAAG